MLPCLLLTILAPPVGAYSGVSVDNLLDTPILKSQPVVELQGEALQQASKALTRADDRFQAGDGFELALPAHLQPGRYVLVVECEATSVGNDSFWVEVDGERDTRPMTLPRDRIGEARAGVVIEQAGPHTIRLVLREGSGVYLERVALTQVTVDGGRPAMVAERAAHPRMLFTAADIPMLRERAATPLGQLSFQLSSASQPKPPAYDPQKRSAGSYRALASIAFSEVLDPQPKRMETIVRWVEEALTFETWGIGSSADIDLDAEYMMEGLAFTYDWLHDRLPPELRDRLRDNLAHHCEVLYSASLAGRTGGGHSFQQNHFWFAHLALAMGAAAIHGEDPRAEEWLAWAWDRFERVFLTLGDDGGFHEGPGYYDFSMPTLFNMIDLYEQLSGLPIPYGDEGLAKSAAFRFHHLVPGLGETVPLEDTKLHHRLPARWVFAWLASRYDDPVAQGMVSRLTEAPNSHYRHLLAIDPDLAPVDPTTRLPLAAAYDDVDTAFARSSWDDDATMLAFVARPMGGEKYAELCRRYRIEGTGHNHPEQNHFVLWSHGELLATDPGYTYEKKTANHNTVLVDAQGQYGDGEMWPRANPGQADIIGFTTDGDVTIMTGEAAGSYPAELGLKRFERTICLVGRDLVIIRDRLLADQPRTFQWRQIFQGEGAARPDGATIAVGDAQAVIHAAMPAESAVAITERTPQFVHPTRDHTPENSLFQVLELTSPKTAEATFLVVEQLGAKGDAAAAPDIERTAEQDSVRVGGTTVVFSDATVTVVRGTQRVEHRLRP